MDIETKKLVYIASPVRPVGGITLEENLEFARRSCEYAIKRGVAPVAPHLLYTQFLDDSVKEDRELGMQAGYSLLNHCDELWICGDYVSEGMRSEIQYASEHNIIVKSVSSEVILRG